MKNPADAKRVIGVAWYRPEQWARLREISEDVENSRTPTKSGGKRLNNFHIGTSAGGYIARPDGDLEWLTSRPAPGFYGMDAFMQSIDTKVLGRKTFEVSLRINASR
jgi:hypothetical protein